MRPVYQAIIDELDLLGRLAAFRPVVIGTPPLGIDTEDSDIDLACSAADLVHFSTIATEAYGHLPDFACRHLESRDEPTVLVSFHHRGWPVELFCQRLDTGAQWGVRHFRIEQRLLALDPRLRDAVVHLKRQGVKTEPAFARLLGLPGDAYAAMLTLEEDTDAHLRALIAAGLETGAADGA